MTSMDDLHRHALVFCVLEIRAAVCLACRRCSTPVASRSLRDLISKVGYTSTALVPIDLVLTGGGTARGGVWRQRRVFITHQPERAPARRPSHASRASGARWRLATIRSTSPSRPCAPPNRDRKQYKPCMQSCTVPSFATLTYKVLSGLRRPCRARACYSLKRKEKTAATYQELKTERSSLEHFAP